jgi:hypothetical protein
MMQSSIDDQDMTVDLSGLAESLVDSDDEEGSYAESTEVRIVIDCYNMSLWGLVFIGI